MKIPGNQGVYPRRASARRGMTLIETVVGTALILIVFVGIYAVYQISIDLVFSTKAATGGTALVNEQIEYIRGLSYDSIGTIGGIPAGAIPQVQTRTLNGVPYTLSTLVQYVDDAADGEDVDDENGITADYKLVRISADWMIRGRPRATFAITRISPHGIESLASGGTLRVNAFDILAGPVSGATVHIVNTNLDPDVDVTVTTGASGSIAFPGAPPGAGYKVTVSKTGYSSAQTYDVSVANPNPNPGHVAVVDQTTTTVSLEINVLGSLAVSTFSPVGPGSFDDSLDDSSKLSATTSATVLGSALVLEGEPGSYVSTGSATSVSISPALLAGWTSVTWNAVTPTDTGATVDVYYWDGAAFALVPDSDLPGNGAGFSGGFIDLSTLPIAAYPTLRLMMNLSSADVNATPEIQDYSVAYTAGPTPLPNVPFDIHGARTIGTTAGGAPIYKYDAMHTTTQYGTWLIDPVEPDAYTITADDESAFTVSEMCPAVLSVGSSEDAAVTLTLVDGVSQSLRVVVSALGAPLADAAVHVVGTGVDETLSTSACGQAFFSIPSGTYSVTVSAAGYQTSVNNNMLVSGATVAPVPLAQ